MVSTSPVQNFEHFFDVLYTVNMTIFCEMESKLIVAMAEISRFLKFKIESFKLNVIFILKCNSTNGSNRKIRLTMITARAAESEPKNFQVVDLTQII